MNKRFSYITVLFVSMLFFLSPAYANDIYIQQSGDNLDLDITQDGQNNVVGTSGTDVTLAGDDMILLLPKQVTQIPSGSNQR